MQYFFLIWWCYLGSSN